MKHGNDADAWPDEAAVYRQAAKAASRCTLMESPAARLPEAAA
jgi:hypothetical protein